MYHFTVSKGTWPLWSAKQLKISALSFKYLKWWIWKDRAEDFRCKPFQRGFVPKRSHMCSPRAHGIHQASWAILLQTRPSCSEVKGHEPYEYLCTPFNLSRYIFVRRGGMRLDKDIGFLKTGDICIKSLHGGISSPYSGKTALKLKAKTLIG